MENVHPQAHIVLIVILSLAAIALLVYTRNKIPRTKEPQDESYDWIGDYSPLFEDKETSIQKYINVDQISSIEIMDDLKVASDKYDEQKDRFFSVVREDKKYYFNEKSGRYYRDGGVLYFCICLEITMTNKERHYKYFTSNEEAIKFVDITLCEHPHIIL